MKHLFYLYQRGMWYFSIAVDEARKPLRLWNEIALLTLLIASAGWHLSLMQIISAYIIGALVLILIGYFLVGIGIVEYNQKLNNSQNQELKRILEIVEELKKRP